MRGLLSRKRGVAPKSLSARAGRSGRSPVQRALRRLRIRLIRRATRPFRLELKQLERETDFSPF
ncbi:hypothetical protein CAL20_06085 [Bordetella genomosp. 4]|uniref:Uncharacterized protein n=1 Tax=Bordetella genomosp. 4 TaxID=463044 RepID=A0A261UCG0_9BORD|nr:hypothetical protein CAL21_15420 [Bordetella genomosp. 4]OZI59187.1 hypothetical protein CAL20_06085 [Bordetella genomosp. 4]